MQAVDYAAEKLRRSIDAVMAAEGNRLNQTVAHLEGFDAAKILSRGYVVCSDARTGGVIRSAGAALEARDVRLAFADGRVSAEVKERFDGK